jgi:hypothetical protein
MSKDISFIKKQKPWIDPLKVLLSKLSDSEADEIFETNPSKLNEVLERFRIADDEERRALLLSQRLSLNETFYDIKIGEHDKLLVLKEYILELLDGYDQDILMEECRTSPGINLNDVHDYFRGNEADIEQYLSIKKKMQKDLIENAKRAIETFKTILEKIDFRISYDNGLNRKKKEPRSCKITNNEFALFCSILHQSGLFIFADESKTEFCEKVARKFEIEGVNTDSARRFFSEAMEIKGDKICQGVISKILTKLNSEKYERLTQFINDQIEKRKFKQCQNAHTNLFV